MPRVCAAVLNFNGRRLLEVILPSLAAQEYRDFEIVVVDNASTDDSIEYLRREWPAVRIVSTGASNIGVSAALNIAVRASESELLALLNNDIELHPAWLGELVAALDAHPEAATAAGKLLNFHRRDLIDGAADIFTRSGVAWGRGSGQLDRGQYDQSQEVFAPTAGAGLYRASSLSDVGAFDESFLAYYEDVDWGLRAQLAGYRSRYVPTALGYHMGSATTRGDRDPVFYELKRRNSLAVLVKDVPSSFLLRNLHRIVFAQMLSVAFSVRAGMLRSHLRAFRAAINATPEWLRARREIMRGRRIEPREFDRFVSNRRS